MIAIHWRSCLAGDRDSTTRTTRPDAAARGVPSKAPAWRNGAELKITIAGTIVAHRSEALCKIFKKVKTRGFLLPRE